MTYFNDIQYILNIFPIILDFPFRHIRNTFAFVIIPERKNMKPSKIVALIAVCALFPSCSGSGSRLAEKYRNARRDTVTVGVVRLEKTPNVETAGYVGTVQPSQNAIVSAQYPGTVVELDIKKGQRVRKGQTIAVISSETVNSAYEIARAKLDQARDGYDRMMEVYGKGGASEVKKVEITTILRQAEAAEKAAARAVMDCTVKAPYDGVVDEVFIEKGVEAGALAPIARIMNVASVEIRFPVPENEIAGISPGQAVSVEIPALKRTVEGAVTVRGTSASVLSHSYECTCLPSSGAEGLLPGMVCKVRIAQESEGRIVVPVQSVCTDMDGRYVWCVSGGKAEKRYVTVDGYSGKGVIVAEGLEDGCLLIVEGASKVSGGMAVKTVGR